MSKIDNFTLSGLLFSLLLFGAVTTMTLNFGGDMFNTYNQTVDDSALSDAAQNVNTNINQDLDETRQEAESVGGGIGANLFFLKPVWNIISTTLGAIPLVSNVLTDLSTIIPIPAELQSLIFGFVIIGVAYAIVRLYRGGST